MTSRSRRGMHVGVKLKDVAAAAGVSTATVSRALRDSGMTADSTAARVRRVAAQLGYVRYGPAAALSSMRSGLVGMRIVDRAGPLDEAFADLCERELAVRGQLAVVQQGGEDAIRRLLEAGVGAVLAIGNVSDEERALIGSRHLRLATAGAGELDFDRGAEALVGFLYDGGHRRIALADRGGASAGLEVAWATALRDRCKRASIDVSPHGPSLPADLDEALRTLRTWLEHRDSATALVCTSDLAAACAVRACAYAGIPVPAQFSIAGLGDADLARLTLPALTTVRLPVRQAAAAAAAVAAGTPSLGQTAPAESARAERARLVVRGSIGPVRPS